MSGFCQVLIGLLLIVTAVACAPSGIMHERDLPASEVAIIEIRPEPTPKLGRAFWSILDFVGVDGASLYNHWTGWSPTRLSVLPGRHVASF